MSLTLTITFFITGLFALFLVTAYYFKNVYLIFCASVLSLILGAGIFIGGITTNTTTTVTLVDGTYTITDIYTPIDLGFSTNYVAVFFTILGLFLFLQGIGASLQTQLVTPT